MRNQGFQSGLNKLVATEIDLVGMARRRPWLVLAEAVASAMRPCLEGRGKSTQVPLHE
jgi:hypothetical protein